MFLSHFKVFLFIPANLTEYGLDMLILSINFINSLCRESKLKNKEGWKQSASTNLERVTPAFYNVS